MPPKTPPTEQEGYKTLRGLAPMARMILELEEVFEVGIGLKSTLAALESRKTALSAEVAGLLKQAEAGRLARAQEQEAWQKALAEIQDLRKAEQEGLHADRAARATQDAEAAKAIRERQETILASHREELNRLRSEIAELTAQKAGLLKDLDETLTKYARR